MMQIDLIATPITGAEVMSILGLSVEHYGTAVAVGALRKGVRHEHRASECTSHHNFYDMLNLLLWAKMSDWGGLIDNDSLVAILDEVEDARGLYDDFPDANDYLRLQPVANNIDHHYEPEIVDEIMKIVAEVDHIWVSLFESVNKEIGRKEKTDIDHGCAERIESLREVLTSRIHHLSAPVFSTSFKVHEGS